MFKPQLPPYSTFVYNVLHIVCVVTFSTRPTRLFFSLSLSPSRFYHNLSFLLIRFFLFDSRSLSLFLSLYCNRTKTRTPCSIINANTTTAVVTSSSLLRHRCQCNANIINFTVQHDDFHVTYILSEIECVFLYLDTYFFSVHSFLLIIQFVLVFFVAIPAFFMPLSL